MENTFSAPTCSAAEQLLGNLENLHHSCLHAVTGIMNWFSKLRFFNSHIDRREALELSLNEILDLECQIQQGKIRLSTSDMQTIKQLKSMILFFHEVFPESDPYGVHKYSLKL